MLAIYRHLWLIRTSLGLSLVAAVKVMRVELFASAAGAPEKWLTALLAGGLLALYLLIEAAAAGTAQGTQPFSAAMLARAMRPGLSRELRFLLGVIAFFVGLVSLLMALR